MSELLREAIIGPVGKRIGEDLMALIESLDKAVLRSIRDDTKTYDDARYRAGTADGVRIALNLVMALGKQPSA